MSIFNRRNAALGWLTWTIGKRFAERKAKETVGADGRSKKPVVLAVLAATAAALFFWRRRTEDDVPPPAPTAEPPPPPADA